MPAAALRGAVRLAVPALALGVTLASPAAATTCRQWQELDEEARDARIDRMIERVVTGHTAQQYDVSKGRVARCLEGYAPRMALDFDDVCADRRTAGMQAIQNVFHKYVWSCVR